MRACWEMDTVLGLEGDSQRVLTLYNRPSHLQLALLLPDGTCGSAKAALSALSSCAPEAFGALVRLVLADNGAEFSDEGGIGALLGEGPGGAPRPCYCDPMRSDQKGGCEKNHSELRQVLRKGLFSFDLLVPADLALAMSHANSNPRASLCGMSPVRMFLAAHGALGEQLLDALGVEEVPAGALFLKPGLLERGRAERGEPPLGL